MRFIVALFLFVAILSSASRAEACDLSLGECTITFTHPSASPIASDGIPAQPGGRLSLVAATPHMTGPQDVSSGTLYYAPYKGGGFVPVLDSSLKWTNVRIAIAHSDAVGRSISGGSKWTANKSRDVFMTLSGDLCTNSVPWPSAGTAARELGLYDGVTVNASVITCDTSSTTNLSCAQYQCTYLGSINVGAVAGQLVCTFEYGQNRRCDVWNFYNQEMVRLWVGQPVAAGTVMWKYCNSTVCPQYPAFSPLDGNPNNAGAAFTGMPEPIVVKFHEASFVNGVSGLINAVGHNSTTTANCGSVGKVNTDWTLPMGLTTEAHCVIQGGVGANVFTMLIAGMNNIAGVTYSGGDRIEGRGGPDWQSVMWIEYHG